MKARFVLCTLTILFVLSISQIFAQDKSRTIIHCGTLIDAGVSMQPMKERSIIVENGRVVEVRQGFINPDPGDRLIDLKNHYVLPGLIDMHTHITGQFRKDGYIDRFRLTAADQAFKSVEYVWETLLAGFTTIRNLGSGDGVGISLRNAINQGIIAGPRMFVAGKSLAITGGHADPTNGAREDILGIPTEEHGVADGVESARKAARLAIKRGADQIKITATGGVLSVARDGKSPQFFEDEIKAIVDVANGFGLKVTAHAHGDEGMKRAIRAGISSIEHGTYMSPETMKMMKENGVYLVATITAGKSTADSAKIPNYYHPLVTKKAIEIGPVIQNTFAKAYKAGVPLAFGTDAGVFPHGKNAIEFVYMVEAGMPAMEAIKCATVNAADLLDKKNVLGSLQPGYYADIVAVEKNPLVDISVLQDISFVMKEGVIYKENRAANPKAFGLD